MRTRPSERERWSACSGYPAFKAVLDEAGELPESSESEAAWRGTVGHTICEEVIGSDENPVLWTDWAQDPIGSVRAALEYDGREYVNPRDESIRYTVDIELIDGVVDCIMTVADAVLKAGPGAMVWLEQPVQFNDRLGGTPDVVVWSKERRQLNVIDYKFGKGHAVAVKGNKQLQVYACAACRTHGLQPERVNLCIVQPAKGGASWRFHDASELSSWAVKLEQELRTVAAPERRLAAGSWCRWCDCAPFCPAQVQAQEAALAYAAVPVQVDSTVVQMGERLRQHEDVLSPYAEALRGELRRRLEGDLCSPEEAGWKLAAKRASRKWASEAEVAQWLLSQGVDESVAYKQVLMSPAQLEKLIKGGSLPLSVSGLESLCTRESSGTNLVRLSSERTAAPRLEALGALPASATSVA